MKAYHYTSGQGLFGILNSGELHCTNLRFMNDPSEEFYFDKLLEEVLKTDKTLNYVYKNLYNHSYHTSIKPANKFIASFSKNEDSLSMWNYYAKGNGYNFEVDIRTIVENNRGGKLHFREIELNYDKEKQINLLQEFIFSHLDNATEYYSEMKKLEMGVSESEENYILLNTGPLIEAFNDELDGLKVGFKHPAYSREEEIRLIVSEAPGPKEGESEEFKITTSGVFVNYISLSLDFPSSISAITTHPLNGDLHTLGIKEFVKSHKKFRKIEVRNSSIPFREV